MPFKSEAQKRYLYAKKPEIAEEFEHKTPDKKKLPEHKNREPKKRGMMGSKVSY